MSHTKKYSALLQTVAANLKVARQARGLTQEDMDDFGFNYRHYQKLESGKHSPSLLKICKVAAALKTTPERLLK